jgi:hypothetical protein
VHRRAFFRLKRKQRALRGEDARLVLLSRDLAEHTARVSKQCDVACLRALAVSQLALARTRGASGSVQMGL